MLTNTENRIASVILVGLGAGHLTLSIVITHSTVGGWIGRGLWASVPLRPPDDGLRNGLAFWAGPGSFSVPLVLLGILIWHLAGRGITPPAALGWALAAWCLVGGLLLVPSPFLLGSVAGLLIVRAARKAAKPPARPAGETDGGTVAIPAARTGENTAARPTE
ncbi:hypothetical protein KOI35_03465 [Actinoplanes bogorensis]|uniref:Uncharacterized protein n=1 Tax=Paractinoplanes bogorensis TaxID=1610840 RepID=A0ABS5YGH6_9ACTN|nr:DUF6463 family protein [Actinoplanes bogorensis]MBU2662555.1 hypothetical protein [Actinoplanes bogorensis]